MNDQDQFVIHRLRAKPFDYTVKISHFVQGAAWVMGVEVHGIAEMDAEQRSRVAADLRYAAELLETKEWVEK